MTDPEQKKDDWLQFAEDVAACAYNVVCALVPEKETRDTIKKTCLETQAKVFKGLLTIVESKLNDFTPAKPHQTEKIKID